MESTLSNADESQDFDPVTELPVMPVGDWALEKHELLRRYIGASWAVRRQWHNRSFIDLYCGPGRIRVRDTNVEAEGGALVAWLEARKHGGCFTQVLIGDKDQAAATACETRLTRLGAPVKKVVGDADATVDQILAMVPQRGLHLAYLDPFNVEHLPFSVIQKLSKFKNIDIVVHYSVMDVQRNIELDFLRDASRFEGFAPGWKNHVGVDGLPKHQIAQEFTSYWLSLVKSLGFNYAKEMPLMTNSKNGPLYRMVFLLRHPLAEKLWNDIAKPLNRSLFD